MEFLACLHRVTRNDEDDTSVTFKCDAQQIDKVNLIPTQTLLKVTIDIEE